MGIGMATAQTNSVSGTVYSESDGDPVVGASVWVVVTEGTGFGVSTDIEGKFSIKNLPANATHLRVTYVGMAEQEVKIQRGKAMKITLREGSESLEEVMVVAFGSAKVVDAEMLETTQVTSVTNALAGKVAGVQMTSSNGAPGSESSIIIRGITSINAGGSPLIVVDGAPYSGDLDNINPNDVESMTVLKDAASRALYDYHKAG